MSHPYRHPPLDGMDIDSPMPRIDPCPLGDDDPHDDHGFAELEFLIARFDRIVSDQQRSRRYTRRSNTVTPGFRRNQRRGIAS